MTETPEQTAERRKRVVEWRINLFPSFASLDLVHDIAQSDAEAGMGYYNIETDVVLSAEHYVQLVRNTEELNDIKEAIAARENER